MVGAHRIDCVDHQTMHTTFIGLQDIVGLRIKSIKRRANITQKGIDKTKIIRKLIENEYQLGLQLHVIIEIPIR